MTLPFFVLSYNILLLCLFGITLRYKTEKITNPRYDNQTLPMLVDTHNHCLPEPSAAVWGWDLWLSSKYNTTLNRLNDLCVFYEYCANEHQTFFEEAAKLNILTNRQINNLGTFLLHNFNYELEDGVSIAPSTYNRRIDSIILFLKFHYNRYIERLDDYDKKEQVQKSVDRACGWIAKKRYSKAQVDNATKQTKPLNNDEIDIIKKIIRPSTDSFTNEINPFRRQLQVRNACAILLLLELGCRASELVLIRSDKDLKLTTNPSVVIQFSEDSEFRNRRDGASHKTRFRELPISRGLAALILEYLEEHRPFLRKAYKGSLTNYLFISEKDGGALTTSGLDYMITKIYQTIPNLADVIHPHRFRVTRGTELRSNIDTKYENSNSPMTQAGETQDLLTTWGGWSTTSDMTRRYTQAHLQRKISDYLRGKED